MGKFLDSLNYFKHGHLSVLKNLPLTLGLSLSSYYFFDLKEAVSIAGLHLIGNYFISDRDDNSYFTKKFVDKIKYPDFKLKDKLNKPEIFLALTAGLTFVYSKDLLFSGDSSLTDILMLKNVHSANIFKLLVSYNLIQKASSSLVDYYYLRKSNFFKSLKDSFIGSYPESYKDSLENLSGGSKNLSDVGNLVSYYFSKNQFDESMTLFFDYFFMKKEFLPLATFESIPISFRYLDSKKDYKKLFVSSLFFNLPKEITQGITNELVKESIKEKDLVSLVFSSYYLDFIGEDVSNIWDLIGELVVDDSDSLDSIVHTTASSVIKKVKLGNFSSDFRNDHGLVDVGLSTILQKEKVYSKQNLNFFNDEVTISKYCFNTHKQDHSLHIPYVLHDPVVKDNLIYSLFRVLNSPSLSSVVLNNPNDFKEIVSAQYLAFKKIKKDYLEIKDLGLINFKKVIYEKRVVDQETNFSKKYFLTPLAKKLHNKLNTSSLKLDTLLPSTDSLPEQWLLDLDNLVFSRVDFENKGLRPSIEDYVNSVLYVYDSLPEENISYLLNYYVDKFGEENNISKEVSAPYFLDTLFERRNHLVNFWHSHKLRKNNIPELLRIVDLASSEFSPFVLDKNYLSSQNKQNQLFSQFIAQ